MSATSSAIQDPRVLCRYTSTKSGARGGGTPAPAESARSTAGVVLDVSWGGESVLDRAKRVPRGGAPDVGKTADGRSREDHLGVVAVLDDLDRRSSPRRLIAPGRPPLLMILDGRRGVPADATRWRTQRCSNRDRTAGSLPRRGRDRPDRDHRRRAARPRTGAPRRRHGAVGDPLRGSSRSGSPRLAASVVDRGNIVAPEPEALGGAGRAARGSCPRSSRLRAARRAGRGGRLDRVRCRSSSAATTRSRSARSRAAQPRRAGRRVWIDAHGDLNTPGRRARPGTSTGCRSRPRSACGRRVRSPRLDAARRSIRGVSSSSGSARSTRPSGRCPRAGHPRLHDDATSTGSGSSAPMREALDRVVRTGVRPRLARPRLARPGDRPGRRDARAGRPHLPRGAPRVRAHRRVGHRRLVRGRRGEPDPRPREPTAAIAVELVASALGQSILWVVGEGHEQTRRPADDASRVRQSWCRWRPHGDARPARRTRSSPEAW